MAIGNQPLGNMGIKVSLDDTKLNSSASNMKALLKSVNEEFKANLSAVKMTGNQMDVTATKVDGLSKKYEAQKKVVDSTREAYEKARKEAEKEGASQAQIRAMESKRQAYNKEIASLNSIQSELNQTQKEYDEMISQNKKLETSFGKLDNQLKQTGDKLKGIGSKLTSAGSAGLTKLTAPILAVGGLAFKQASDVEESMNKTNVAFGKNADEVKKWSESTLTNIGVAQGSALDLASMFGDMGGAMGLSEEQNKKYAMSLTDLAGDLASFKNIDMEQAKTALKGVYTGEGEALLNSALI